MSRIVRNKVNKLKAELAPIGGAWTPMLYGVVFMVLGCAGMLAADTTPWRIVPPLKTDKLLPELPPLAVVERRDDSGKTWRIEGSLGGTRVVAESDFKLCFERQGLRLDKVISIGRDKQSLYLWRRGGKGIILMLHETGVARTDFAVGLDDSPSQAAGRPLARNLPHGLTEAQTGEEFKQRQ